MGRGATAVSDGTSVWAFGSDDEKMVYDATTTVYPKGESDDVFVAKYAASDGAGLWATSIGGTGKDRFSDAAITPLGHIHHTLPLDHAHRKLGRRDVVRDELPLVTRGK